MTDDTTVIARVVARIVVPLVLVTAVSLLLQGHNLPGGGFIAGVLTAAGFALLYIVYGIEYLETEVFAALPASELDVAPGLVRDYWVTFAAGLAIAAGSGVAAIAFGEPFLTQDFWEREHPVTVLAHELVGVASTPFHEIEIASAIVFDVGVYLVVVGALLTIVAEVGSE